MGVKSLWTLLSPVGRPVPLQTMEGKIMAIDSSIWIYQFQATMRDKEGRGLVNAHVLGFLRRISKLLFYGIKPVFVFDGGAPALKRSTLNERKKKKSGAAMSHTKLAEKLLAAQLRREALSHTEGRSKSKKKGPPPPQSLDDNTVYLEDIDGSAPRTPSKKKDPPPPSSSGKAKNKYYDYDPYKLPEVDVHVATSSSAPDPRLATEDELRTFIEEMRPEDFDINSPAFRDLSTEIQYEIVGDLRLRSRQTSYARLQNMLKNAHTPLDFSKQQIKNLQKRNALTQQLLATTDTIGSAHILIPVRIASERNKEYVLVKNEAADGGWILGIRDTGTQEKPIVIDHDSGSEEESGSDADMEEIEVPAPAPPDPDLRNYQREMALSAISSRHSAKKLAPVRPIVRNQKSTSLFISSDDEEVTGVEASAAYGDEGDEEDDDMLQFAIQESLDQARKKATGEGSSSKTRLGTTHQDSSPELDDNFIPPRLHTQLTIGNIAPSKTQSSPSTHGKGHLRSSSLSSPSKFQKSPSNIEFAAESDGDSDMEEVVVPVNLTNATTVASPSPCIEIVAAAVVEPSHVENLPVSPSRSPSSFTNITQKPSQPLIHSLPQSSFTSTVPSVSVKKARFEEPPPNTGFGTSTLMGSQLSFGIASSVNTAGPASDVEGIEVDRPGSRSEDPPNLTSPSLDAIIRTRPAAIKQTLEVDSDVDMEEVLVKDSTPPPPNNTTPSIEPREDTVLGQPLFVPSRSPSPFQDPAGSRPPSPPHEDWDAVQEIDIHAEEGEFARFMSQVKGKNLDDVRKEIDDEIRTLNQQRKAALRDSEDVTQQMISQIMTMLRLFGIPYITAPMEAEAQCAELVTLGLVDGVITDDSDVFLFGAQRVYKNMFNQSKTVECFLLSDLEREIGLDRETLIQLAYLLGSDYTDGLPGVGPVMAMELLKEFPGHNGLFKFRDWWLKVQTGKDKPEESASKFRRRFKKRFKELYLPPDWPNSVVRDAYYHPAVDSSDEPFKWALPDLDGLRDFFQQELSWSKPKVDELLLPIIQKMNRRGQENAPNRQGTLNEFLDVSVGSGTHAPRQRQAYASRRLQEVITDFRKRQKSVSAGSSRASSKQPTGDEDQSDDGSAGKLPARKRARMTKGAKKAGVSKKSTGATTSAKAKGRTGSKAKKGRLNQASKDGPLDEDDSDEFAAPAVDRADEPTLINRATEFNLRPRPKPRPIPRPLETAASALVTSDGADGDTGVPSSSIPDPVD